MTRNEAKKAYIEIRKNSGMTAKDFDYAVLSELSNNFEDRADLAPGEPVPTYEPAAWVSFAKFVAKV